MIDQLKAHYPVQRLCQVLSLPRSSYYAKPARIEPEPGLVVAVEQVLMRFPTYGYRRVRIQLRRQGVQTSERQVRRVLQHLGVTRQVGKVRTTDSSQPHQRYPNRLRETTVTALDQVWVADITYLRFGYRFFYLAVILDAYSRAVRGWSLGRRLEEGLTLTALRQALRTRQPQIFHSDQGAQYTATDHVALLQQAQITVSMADVGEPTQNALAERFIRTLKEEHVAFTEYDDFDDAYQQLKQWLEVEYMHQRIHSALDYQTPAEFEVACQPPLPRPA